MGDNIGLDEEKTRKIFREEFLTLVHKQDKRLSKEDYEVVAKDLIQSFTPPSILHLFPESSEDVREAIPTLNWEDHRLVKGIGESTRTSCYLFSIGNPFSQKNYNKCVSDSRTLTKKK